MEYREPYLTECRNPEYAVRRKVNGQSVPFFPSTAEGQICGRLFVHTFTKLLPPELYFDTHPEYYAEVHGERLREKTQLCLTNPAVLELVTARVLEELRKQPDAGIFRFHRMTITMAAPAHTAVRLMKRKEVWPAL